ncbi:hypothetical protein GCM10009655_24060 [Rhodoglobus aureus]|uniref:Uncharacterized protein n=1 Tax=Rhodoglobus aureus TaxID=191497 RepID=A0ABP4GG19_9MICO
MAVPQVITVQRLLCVSSVGVSERDDLVQQSEPRKELGRVARGLRKITPRYSPDQRTLGVCPEVGPHHGVR